jgi:hypothetical protein
MFPKTNKKTSDAPLYVSAGLLQNFEAKRIGSSDDYTHVLHLSTARESHAAFSKTTYQMFIYYEIDCGCDELATSTERNIQPIYSSTERIDPLLRKGPLRYLPNLDRVS